MDFKTSERSLKTSDRGMVKFTKMLPVLDRLTVLAKITEETGKHELSNRLARRKAEIILTTLENPSWAHYDYLRNGYFSVATIAEKRGLADLERIAGVHILAIERVETPKGGAMLDYAINRFSKFSITPQEIGQAEDKIRALQTREHTGKARKSKGIKLEVTWERDEVKRETKRLIGKMAELEEYREGKEYDVYSDHLLRQYQEISASAEKIGLASIAREAAIQAAGLTFVQYGKGDIVNAHRCIKGFITPYVSRYGITQEEMEAAVLRALARMLYQNSPASITRSKGHEANEEGNFRLMRNICELAGLNGKEEAVKMAMGTIRKCLSEGRYSNALRAVEFLGNDQAEEISSFLHSITALEHDDSCNRRINGELVVPIEIDPKFVTYS